MRIRDIYIKRKITDIDVLKKSLDQKLNRIEILIFYSNQAHLRIKETFIFQ